MIPKIIHYCWFGGKEKPKKMQKCIQTWKEKLSDYVFMEWNESNFDINSLQYVSEAYERKKFAFVSDVARIQVLKKYGGIYMDTDVVVYKSFDEILANRCVLGLEYDNWVATSFMACEQDHPILEVFEKEYSNIVFTNPDGKENMTTNVQRLTRILTEKGLVRENTFQRLEDGIVIYPIEYFSPYDYANCIMEKTDNTFCAHLFFVTWLPKKEQLKKWLKKIFVRVFGKQRLILLRKKRAGK